MLFNEPKLLKSITKTYSYAGTCGFSALQRAEIAEMHWNGNASPGRVRFSALQRAEIAEMLGIYLSIARASGVSVLFNEPKLLKLHSVLVPRGLYAGFSALQRAEIAEMDGARAVRLSG